MIQFNNACVAGAFFTAVVVLLSGCKRSEFDGPEWKVQDPEMTVLFQKMSDAALNDLVRRGVGRDELVSIFGEPTLSLKQDDAESFYLLEQIFQNNAGETHVRQGFLGVIKAPEDNENTVLGHELRVDGAERRVLVEDLCERAAR